MLALETNYTDTIRDLKHQIDVIQKKFKKLQGQKVNTATEKGELEVLFVDCIEDVRKEIMRRRLKNEILTRKKSVTAGSLND